MSDTILATVGGAAVIELLSQGYLTNFGQNVVAKTKGQPTQKGPGRLGVTVLGFGVAGGMLLAFDRGETAPIAEAMAVVLLGTVVLMRGVDAFAQLGGLFNLSTQSWLPQGALQPTPTPA